jgi:uncharacterized protein YidB (DUF937 family)
MFSEILKINPRLDNSDLNKMDRSLSQRFAGIAKKFGKGLGGVLAGGGIAGIALGFVDKLLNPLKETQDRIDALLKQGDDIVTNAQQFGTTAGKLFKLRTLAKSTGLDEENLFMLINKFQNSVAEAAADPKKESAVRQFVNIPDTGDAFFQFIQSLQAMKKTDPNGALLAEQQVFGEKQILKLADFIATDFGQQLRLLMLAPDTTYNAAANASGSANDVADIKTAKREADEFVRKSGLITPAMLELRDQQIRNEEAREEERMRNYQSLMALSEASSQMLGRIEKEGLALLREIAPGIKKISDIVSKLSISRFVKGMLMGDGK